MAEEHPKSPSPVTASKKDPSLNVYGLSEFVFCSRAGLCAHEQDEER